MKPPRIGMGRTPAGLPFGRGSDRARLGFLLALLVVFGVGFVYLRYQWTRQVETPQEQDEYVAREATGIAREPAARIDFERLRAVRDATRTERLIREPDAYSHLLAEARKLTPGDLEALGMKRANAAEIRAAPAEQRGEPFEVKGRLAALEVVQGQLWQEIRGRIVDPHGAVFVFTVLREPDAAVGDVVRLGGFFFKLFALEVTPGEYVDEAVHLVGKTLVRSFLEMTPVTDLAAVSFSAARDFDVTEMVDLQEELLFPVLSYVQSLDQTARAELPATEVSWADLRREPDRYRGKVVRILARHAPGLEWPRRLGPAGENPLAVETFRDGILALPKGRLIRWIGLDPLPREILRQSRLVYLTGVFVKNHAWENVRRDILSGPLIVPIRFERFTQPKSEVYHYIGYGITGTTLLLTLLFLVGVFRDSQKSKAFRREFLRRKKRVLGRALEAGRDAAPPAPPDAQAPS